MYIIAIQIAIQIAILIAHSVLFQFSVMPGHVQVVLASIGHESGAHTANYLEDCRHYKKHRSTSVSVVGCHFPGLWVSKS